MALRMEHANLNALIDEALQPLLEGRGTQIKTLIDPWAASARPAVY